MAGYRRDRRACQTPGVAGRAHGWRRTRRRRADARQARRRGARESRRAGDFFRRRGGLERPGEAQGPGREVGEGARIEGQRRGEAQSRVGEDAKDVETQKPRRSAEGVVEDAEETVFENRGPGREGDEGGGLEGQRFEA